ncbi:hypothetical protein A3Q56_03240 [Intoshia linei]|uniref:Neurotransmitter-gated ion-channel transmembrane domain-containing protein n=1 Tax=Intoshia linei TaxID=1819745 RepID=A0A177B5W3_9BILA|nr:hypothetical protein A3Q56_03240 [Intoshia linei]
MSDSELCKTEYLEKRHTAYKCIIREIINDFSSICNNIMQDNLHLQLLKEWRFVSLLMDRFFLVIFSVVSLGGTLFIILRAPSLYDHTKPLG